MAANPTPRAVRVTFFVLTGLLFGVLLLHVGYGSTAMVSPLQVLKEIFRGPGADGDYNNVVWSIRLTRGLGCLLVGGTLGIVGSAFQALFRNPLADPYIVGVSSGAAVGGAAAEIMPLGGFALLGQSALAFVGGLASLGLVLLLAGRRGVTRVSTLLLSGVVVGSMLAAVLSLFLLAAGQDANRILRWLLGDASRLLWPHVALLTGALLASAALLLPQARALNAFAIGEETARRLGIDTGRLKKIVLIVGSGATAVTVGTVGVIAFLGLASPHIARGLVGVDWRRSMTASLLVGAILMLAADALTQRGIPLITAAFGVQPVMDLPAGVVTALIGAPSLLILLRRGRDT